MSPESNAIDRVAANGQTVNVSKPEPGLRAEVPSSPGGVLALDFDPGEATASREGNDLVFQMDDGSSVVVTDFFVVGDQELPQLELPDGTLVASADFFAGSDMNMETAAGPGGGAPGSGGTNYADDPGALIGNLDKLGMLGTDYWGRDTETGDEHIGLDLPGGSFSFNNGLPMLVAEDAMPGQHLGDGTLQALFLNLSVTPWVGSTVTNIVLYNFPEGVQIYIGDPADGGVLQTPDANGNYSFNLGDFMGVGQGVYLIPPEDSDHDFTFDALVTFTASGGSATLPGQGIVHVDAVADKPDVEAALFDDTVHSGSMTVTEGKDGEKADQALEDGWAKDVLEKNAETLTTSAEDVTIKATLNAAIQFGDYSDTSEAHTALVEVPGQGTWTPTVASPSGVSLVVDEGGNPVILTLYFDADGKFLGENPVDGAVAKHFFQFEVTQEALGATDGKLDLTVEFECADGNFTEDVVFELETGARAVDTPFDEEPNPDNNTSYTFTSEYGDEEHPGAELKVDTIDSKLTVNVGWASEDGDRGQHIDGTYAKPAGATLTDLDAQGEDRGELVGVDNFSTNANSSAPIIISISGGDASGVNTETITEIRLYFDADKGDIQHNGTPLAVHDDNDGKGPYVILDAANGLAASGQGTSGVSFMPHDIDDSTDVALRYEVTVESSSGATAVYSGDTVAVVDAVADKADVQSALFGDATHTGSITLVEGTDGQKADQVIEDGWAKDELSKDGANLTLSAEDVTVKATLSTTIQFGDYTDNSETHTALVEVPDQGTWTPTVTSPQGVSLVVDNAGEPVLLTLYFDAAGVCLGEDFVEGAVAKQFFQFEVAQGSLVATNGQLDLTVDFESSDGNFTEDVVFNLETGAKVVDTPFDQEYDLNNNTSYTFTSEYGDEAHPGAELKVDVIDSTLTVNVGWASEDGDRSQHIDGTYAKPGGATLNDLDGAGLERGDTPGVEDLSTNADASAPIVISISGGDASGENTETITEIRLYFDADKGDIQHNGNVLTVRDDNDGKGPYVILDAANGLALDGQGTSGVSFMPHDANDSTDVALRYEVTVQAQPSGATAVYSGDTVAVVDAVADLPGALDISHDCGDYPQITPDQWAEVSGKAEFNDNDGSERHYVVVTLQNDNWQIQGVGDNDSLLTKNEINAYWNQLTGGKIPAEVLTTVLTPSGNTGTEGTANNSQYLVFEAYMDGDGVWQIDVLASDGSGGLTSVKAALEDAGATFDYVVDPNTGKGELTYTINVGSPDAVSDDSATLYTKAITVETPADGDMEYDYANNIAVTGTDNTTVKLDVISSALRVSFSMAEDNEANQHTLGEQGGGWGNQPHGLPLVFDLVELDVNGNVLMDANGPVPAQDAGTDKVTSLTFNSLPDAATQGTLYYNGEEVSAGNIDNLPGAVLDGDKIVFTDPDLTGFTFKPVDDFSGDIDLDVSSVITSTLTGATLAQDQPVETWQDSGGDWHEGDGHLHVDSVADRAVVDGLEAVGRAAGGDADMEPNALEHAKGWSVQTAGESDYVKASFEISGQFTDMDGSEDAFIRIELPEGYEVPTGPGYEAYSYDEDSGCMIVDLGKLDAADGARTVGGLTINADGSYEGSLDVMVKSGTPKTTLTVEVVTTDPAAGHLDDAANNEALISQDVGVDIEYFSGSLTVKAGWIYEGNDGTKHGGQVDPGNLTDADNNAFDANAQATTISGNPPIEGAVPIAVTFAHGTDTDESLTSVTFTWNAEAGDLYMGGLKVQSPAYLSGDKIVNGTTLYFVPKEGYSDADINLNYTAVFKDVNGAGQEVTFTAAGTVDIVVDAVADQAKALNTGVNYETGTGAAIAGEEATINISLQFAKDSSETQYVLIAKGDGSVISGGLGGDLTAQGLTLVDGDELSAAMNDASFADGTDVGDYYVYKVDPSFLDAQGKLNVAVTVETKEGLAGDISESLDVKAVVVEGQAEDGTPLGNNEQLWQDSWEAGEHLANNDEHDFTNNVAVTDVTVTVNVGGIDTSALSMAATAAYEDNNPGQHTLKASDDSSLGSAISLSGLDSSEEIASVTFSFDPPLGVDGNSPVGDVGSFTYKGETYSLANGGITYNTDTGKLELTLTNYDPTDTANKLYYRPGANDSDADIKMDFSAVVKDSASGAEETFTGSKIIQVDAVADRPVSGSGAVTFYQNPDHPTQDPAGYKAADWGSQVTVQVSSQFKDFTDGSESHYLIIEAKAGWTCADAEGAITVTNPDTGTTTTYFYKTATVGADGKASGSFTLTAPDGSDKTIADYNTINADGTVKLASGGLAVEGAIKSGALDYTVNADGTPRDGEGTTGNNVALNTSDASIKFNVVNNATSTVTGTFEDGKPNAHYDASGNPTGTQVDPGNNTGVIAVNLGASSNDTIQGDVEITFSIKAPGWTAGDGAPETMGTFTVNGNELPATCFTYEAGSSGTVNVTIHVPDGYTLGKTGVSLTYTPPADQSTDLDGIKYTMNVQSNDSGAEGQVSGSIGNLVVDAVADRPVLADGDRGAQYDVDGNLDAAVPGAKVTLDVGKITFGDYKDGSEAHYIVVQRTGISWNNENDSKGSNGAVTIGQQTITITGDNGAKQTIVLGANAASSSTITVYDADGNLVSSRALTANEYTQLTNGLDFNTSGSGKIGANYSMIPVLNEFLQLTGNGTVTATIDVNLPNGQTCDTEYTINAGGYAVETEVGGGHTVDNNYAADLKPIEVDVNVVTSAPKLGMIDGHLFENMTPNAHLTDSALQAAQDKLVAYKADPNTAEAPSGTGAVFVDQNGNVLYEKEGKLYTADNKLVDWVDATVAPDNDPAVMQLSGIDKGEMVDITFTFAAKDGSNVSYAGGVVTMVLGDDKLEAVVGADGKAVFDADDILKTFGDLEGKEPVFEFRTPDNYSHEDIKVDYQITVTDPESGHSTTWGSQPGTDANGQAIVIDGQHPLGIDVDAVAQAVEYDSWSDGNAIRAHGGVDKPMGDGIADDVVYSHVERGQAVFLDTVLDVGDMLDGSQGLVLLVEATSAMLKPVSVTIGAMVDGTYMEFTVNFDPKAAPQLSGDGMFYRVEIPAEYLEQLSKAGVNDIDVRYKLDSGNLPSGTVDSDIRVGAITYEKAGEVLVQGQENELTMDNNSAVVITGTGTVHFDGKPSFSLSPGGWVSENDEPRANVGIETKAGGTTLNFNIGKDCSLGDDFSITVELDDEGNPLGNIYLNGSATPLPIDEFGKVDFNGTNFDPHTHKLTFIPADNNKDGDVTLNYSGTVTNNNTGQSTVISNGAMEVVVDAVAQQPTVNGMQMQDDSGGWKAIPSTGIELTHDTKIGDGKTESTGPLLITATFPDNDGSESHYALVKVVANTSLKYFDPDNPGSDVDGWVECTETFIYKGQEYYKVPVFGDGNQKTVQVDITFDSRKLGMGHETDTLTVKALAEENVSETSGDQERDYSNNWAVSEDGTGGGGIIIDHHWPPGHVIWIDPASENNTPKAWLDDLSQSGQQPDETPALGGKIYFGTTDGSEKITEATITVPKDAGTICDASGEELPHTDNGDGSVTYTLTGEALTGSYFVPAHNYSDEDVTITYTAKGENNGTVSGSFPIVVDAVAQLPGVSEDAIKPDYSNDAGSWTAIGDSDKAGNEGLAKITIEGDFKDLDGSETHYALVEKQPGFVICDEDGKPIAVETVYLSDSPNNPDGEVKAYYKIPMADGESSVDVYIKADPDAFDANNELHIKTGVMSVEEGHKATGDANYESDASNNVSWNLEDGQEAVLVYSPVDTEVSFRVNNTGEHGEAVGAADGAINITVDLGDFDKIDNLTITFDRDAGKITWNGGGECADGSLDLTEVLGPDFFKNLPADPAEASAAINAALKNAGLTFVTTGYADADTSLSVTGTVTDSRSGDVMNVGDSHKVIVDAIGHAPDVKDAHGVSESGREAAGAGEAYFAEATLTFEDVGSGELHYAMLGQDLKWPCDKVWYLDENNDWVEGDLITFFDQNGKPYYALAVEDDMLNDDGAVTVRFEMDPPSTSHDISTEVKIGGVSVDPNLGVTGDLELNLLNNWDENLGQTVDLKVGVVDTTEVKGSSIAIAEVQGALDTTDTQIKLEFNTDAGSHDEVTALKLTMPVDGKGNAMGSFWYDGQEYTGDVTITNFNPAKGPFFQPNEYWSGSLDIAYSATVQDGLSGAASDDYAFGGTMTVTVNAVATTPSDVADGVVSYGTNLTAAQSGGSVTFAVTAAFPDHDGSEQHYILVEAKEGWGAPSGWSQTTHGYYEDNGVKYYKVPVPAGTTYDASGNVTVNVTMTTPSGITADGVIDGPDLGALAVENGQNAVLIEGNVEVNIGAVQATSITESATDISEDGTATGGNASQLSFSLDDGSNDEISSISIAIPTGSAIFRDDGNGNWTQMTASGNTVTLDGADAAAGKYYFQPAANASGGMELTYTATVRDAASGATSTINDSVTVQVAAVTDGGVVAGLTTTVTGTDIAGHTAGVNVQLTGSFADSDGSEARFFLVSLPAGVTPPAGWTDVTGTDLATASGLTGSIYRVDVPDSHSAVDYTSGSFGLAVTQDYAGGAIEYVAASYETSLGAGSVVVSVDTNTVNITGGGGGLEYNLAPVVTDSSVESDDFLRTENPTAEGQLVMADADNDTVTVTAIDIDGGTGSGVTDNGATFTVETQYGDLVIDKATGEYVFTLKDGVTPPHGTDLTFNVTVSDDYAANPMTDTGVITITLNGYNTAPTAQAQMIESGGVNEDAFGAVNGTFAITDADNDQAVVIGASVEVGGGTVDAVWNEGTGRWEVTTEYGKFSIAANGSYTYTQLDEQASGTETLNISFQEILYTTAGGVTVYGETGNGTLQVDVLGVNHAPVADHSMAAWDPHGYSIQDGQVAFSDIDQAAQGDNPVVSMVQSGDTFMDMGAFGSTVIEGLYTNLQMFADGSYHYSLKDGVDPGQINAWDVFTYTVTDSGGLTDTAQIGIKLGDAADLKMAFGTSAAESFTASDGYDNFIHGGGGNDTIHGGSGNDTLYGGDGHDLIHAGTGNSFIYGGAGNDMIHAGTGSSLIYGGAGNDTFAWSKSGLGGHDTIADFNMGEDKVQLHSDILGQDVSVDGVLQGLDSVLGNNNRFSFERDNGSRVEMNILNNNELALTLVDQHGTEQVITIQSDLSGYVNDINTVTVDEAQIILHDMLKDFAG